MDSTTLFGTIHGSHYTILANFYLYLQYLQQKIFNFNKISQSQIDLDKSPKKKFTSLPRGSIPYYECMLSPTHKLVGPTADGLWVPPVVRGEKHTPITGCIFSSPSLFLSASPQSTAHQHLYLLSLSQLQTFTTIAQHCHQRQRYDGHHHWFQQYRPFSRWKTPKTVSLSHRFQPPTPEVFLPPLTLDVARKFSSLSFSIYFLNFYVYMCFALLFFFFFLYIFFILFYKLTYTFICRKDLIYIYIYIGFCAFSESCMLCYSMLFQPRGSTAARQHLDRQVSVKLYERQNSSSILTLIHDYVFEFSLLITLDI